MLTRCPSCATHFRVTPEQLKARGGRVRCGQCQQVFNALDSLIEESAVMSAPTAAAAVPPAPTFEPVAQAFKAIAAQAVESAAKQPGAGQAADADATAETPAGDEDWSTTFPEPPPPPRRWPWVIGSLVALTAIVLQALLAFRAELVVLWPQGKPALVALCQIADCEVGLPAKAGLLGIEASDLHPDGEHQGRLVLAATLKNRAPFAQQFPHLELTLTNTADQAIARKVLAPPDYLPPTTPIASGMKSNADILVAIGIDAGGMTASGYRLYLFYP